MFKAGKKKAVAGSTTPAFPVPGNSNMEEFSKMMQQVIIAPMVQALTAGAGSSGAGSSGAGSSGNTSSLNNLLIFNKDSCISFFL